MAHTHSKKSRNLPAKLKAFMDAHIYPNEENYARWCRQADGPDQVHQMALGRQLIDRYGSTG